ncbi:hypothetical protein AX774_g2859 [Zancudomyces culisetae]|uniref:Ras-GAP domain-containing protein n=1 Tax=Zancudomyces culisetae TaxID=1213189 RepID=A0A1R1PRW5_ZANCU|nr:hypothetical protein AX774_g2859 [Zancudomyces culisetae]|eukprot:OMH83632.1 hypothetical protein AX774_g2859 [Zancudomyces culisetae]
MPELVLNMNAGSGDEVGDLLANVFDYLGLRAEHEVNEKKKNQINHNKPSSGNILTGQVNERVHDKNDIKLVENDESGAGKDYRDENYDDNNNEEGGEGGDDWWKQFCVTTSQTMEAVCYEITRNYRHEIVKKLSLLKRLLQKRQYYGQRVRQEKKGRWERYRCHVRFSQLVERVILQMLWNPDEKIVKLALECADTLMENSDENVSEGFKSTEGAENESGEKRSSANMRSTFKVLRNENIYKGIMKSCSTISYKHNKNDLIGLVVNEFKKYSKINYILSLAWMETYNQWTEYNQLLIEFKQISIKKMLEEIQERDSEWLRDNNVFNLETTRASEEMVTGRQKEVVREKCYKLLVQEWINCTRILVSYGFVTDPEIQLKDRVFADTSKLTTTFKQTSESMQEFLQELIVLIIYNNGGGSNDGGGNGDDGGSESADIRGGTTLGTSGNTCVRLVNENICGSMHVAFQIQMVKKIKETIGTFIKNYGEFSGGYFESVPNNSKSSQTNVSNVNAIGVMGNDKINEIIKQSIFILLKLIRDEGLQVETIKIIMEIIKQVSMYYFSRYRLHQEYYNGGSNSVETDKKMSILITKLIALLYEKYVHLLKYDIKNSNVLFYIIFHWALQDGESSTIIYINCLRLLSTEMVVISPSKSFMKYGNMVDGSVEPLNFDHPAVELYKVYTIKLVEMASTEVPPFERSILDLYKEILSNLAASNCWMGLQPIKIVFEQLKESFLQNENSIDQLFEKENIFDQLYLDSLYSHLDGVNKAKTTNRYISVNEQLITEYLLTKPKRTLLMALLSTCPSDEQTEHLLSQTLLDIYQHNSCISELVSTCVEHEISSSFHYTKIFKKSTFANRLLVYVMTTTTTTTAHLVNKVEDEKIMNLKEWIEVLMMPICDDFDKSFGSRADSKMDHVEDQTYIDSVVYRILASLFVEFFGTSKLQKDSEAWKLYEKYNMSDYNVLFLNSKPSDMNGNAQSEALDNCKYICVAIRKALESHMQKNGDFVKNVCYSAIGWLIFVKIVCPIIINMADSSFMERIARDIQELISNTGLNNKSQLRTKSLQLIYTFVDELIAETPVISNDICSGKDNKNDQSTLPLLLEGSLKFKTINNFHYYLFYNFGLITGWISSNNGLPHQEEIDLCKKLHNNFKQLYVPNKIITTDSSEMIKQKHVTSYSEIETEFDNSGEATNDTRGVSNGKYNAPVYTSHCVIRNKGGKRSGKNEISVLYIIADRFSDEEQESNGSVYTAIQILDEWKSQLFKQANINILFDLFIDTSQYNQPTEMFKIFMSKLLTSHKIVSRINRIYWNNISLTAVCTVNNIMNNVCNEAIQPHQKQRLVDISEFPSSLQDIPRHVRDNLPLEITGSEGRVNGNREDSNNIKTMYITGYVLNLLDYPSEVRRVPVVLELSRDYLKICELVPTIGFLNMVPVHCNKIIKISNIIGLDIMSLDSISAGTRNDEYLPRSINSQQSKGVKSWAVSHYNTNKAKYLSTSAHVRRTDTFVNMDRKKCINIKLMDSQYYTLQRNIVIQTLDIKERHFFGMVRASKIFHNMYYSVHGGEMIGYRPSKTPYGPLKTPLDFSAYLLLVHVLSMANNNHHSDSEIRFKGYNLLAKLAPQLGLNLTGILIEHDVDDGHKQLRGVTHYIPPTSEYYTSCISKMLSHESIDLIIELFKLSIDCFRQLTSDSKRHFLFVFVKEYTRTFVDLFFDTDANKYKNTNLNIDFINNNENGIIVEFINAIITLSIRDANVRMYMIKYIWPSMLSSDHSSNSSLKKVKIMDLFIDSLINVASTFLMPLEQSVNSDIILALEQIILYISSVNSYNTVYLIQSLTQFLTVIISDPPTKKLEMHAKYPQIVAMAVLLRPLTFSNPNLIYNNYAELIFIIGVVNAACCEIQNAAPLDKIIYDIACNTLQSIKLLYQGIFGTVLSGKNTLKSASYSAILELLDNLLYNPQVKAAFGLPTCVVQPHQSSFSLSYSPSPSPSSFQPHSQPHFLPYSHPYTSSPSFSHSPSTVSLSLPFISSSFCMPKTSFNVFSVAADAVNELSISSPLTAESSVVAPKPAEIAARIDLISRLNLIYKDILLAITFIPMFNSTQPPSSFSSSAPLGLYRDLYHIGFLWRNKLSTLLSSTMFSFNPITQPSCFVMFGLLFHASSSITTVKNNNSTIIYPPSYSTQDISKTYTSDITNMLISRYFYCLQRSLFVFSPLNATLPVCIVYSLSQLVSPKNNNSNTIDPDILIKIFWISASLLRIGHVCLFHMSIKLMSNTLLLLLPYISFTMDNISCKNQIHEIEKASKSKDIGSTKHDITESIVFEFLLNNRSSVHSELLFKLDSLLGVYYDSDFVSSLVYTISLPLLSTNYYKSSSKTILTQLDALVDDSHRFISLLFLLHYPDTFDDEYLNSFEFVNLLKSDNNIINGNLVANTKKNSSVLLPLYIYLNFEPSSTGIQNSDILNVLYHKLASFDKSALIDLICKHTASKHTSSPEITSSIDTIAFYLYCVVSVLCISDLNPPSLRSKNILKRLALLLVELENQNISSPLLNTVCGILMDWYLSLELDIEFDVELDEFTTSKNMSECGSPSTFGPDLEFYRLFNLLSSKIIPSYATSLKPQVLKVKEHTTNTQSFNHQYSFSPIKKFITSNIVGNSHAPESLATLPNTKTKNPVKLKLAFDSNVTKAGQPKVKKSLAQSNHLPPSAAFYNNSPDSIFNLSAHSDRPTSLFSSKQAISTNFTSKRSLSSMKVLPEQKANGPSHTHIHSRNSSLGNKSLGIATSTPSADVHLNSHPAQSKHNSFNTSQSYSKIPINTSPSLNASTRRHPLNIQSLFSSPISAASGSTFSSITISPNASTTENLEVGVDGNTSFSRDSTIINHSSSNLYSINALLKKKFSLNGVSNSVDAHLNNLTSKSNNSSAAVSLGNLHSLNASYLHSSAIHQNTPLPIRASTLTSVSQVPSTSLGSSTRYTPTLISQPQQSCSIQPISRTDLGLPQSYLGNYADAHFAKPRTHTSDTPVSFESSDIATIAANLHVPGVLLLVENFVCFINASLPNTLPTTLVNPTSFTPSPLFEPTDLNIFFLLYAFSSSIPKHTLRHNNKADILNSTTSYDLQTSQLSLASTPSSLLMQNSFFSPSSQQLHTSNSFDFSQITLLVSEIIDS